MKLERMLSIILYLINHDKVKAQDLADKFEVSIRTIYRDIEALSQAGIPICTYQGADGGIGIVEGYKLDKNILTKDELLNIVTGLKGLYSINEDKNIKLLIDKLSNTADKSAYIPAGNEIIIDLSPWNKNDLLGLLIEDIKKAIQDMKIIEFTYYSGEKVTERRVEPYHIIFKQSNWYFYGYCLLRNDFRLFKLRRMNSLKITDIGFVSRVYSLDDINFDWEKDKNAPVVVLFDKTMEYAVNDIFGIGNYEIAPDGRLKVQLHMGIDWWLYGFLLSFGDKIEVLAPVELRDKIKSIAESICKVYEKT